jgi:glutaminyl-tRNA synthetase
VRLRYGYVIECTSCEKDSDGQITAVHATYFADSKSGTPDANNYKVKGNIHWLSAVNSKSAEVRIFDRLFLEEQPDLGGRDYRLAINPNAKKVVHAFVENSAVELKPGQQLQFERHGYFVSDSKDHSAEKPVFNMSVSLKDSWAK